MLLLKANASNVGVAEAYFFPLQASELRLQATAAASTELRAQCSRLQAALQQAESSSSVLNDRLAQQLESERGRSEESAAVAADAQLWRGRCRDLEASASHLAEARSECARLNSELLASEERLQGSVLQHSQAVEGVRADRDALEAQLATAAAQLHQREEAEASKAAAQHTGALEALHAESDRLGAQLLAACRERDMALSQAATLGEHLGSVMQPVMSALEGSTGQEVKAHANGSASPRQSAGAQVSLQSLLLSKRVSETDNPKL